MGNQCPVCDSEPWEVFSNCSWCKSFLQALNKFRVKRIYRSHEFSPLTMFDEAKNFVGPIEKVVCEGKIACLGRWQNSTDKKDVSSYFNLDPASTSPFNRHDYATFKKWNEAKGQIVLFVPKGIVFFKGVVRAQEQPEGIYQGGKEQIFIPKDVAQALFPASENLRKAGFNEKTCKKFLVECKQALAAQDKWKAEYRKEKQYRNADAHDHNLLSKLQEKLQNLSHADFANVFQCGNWFELSEFKKTVQTTNMKLPKNNHEFKILQSNLKKTRKTSFFTI